MRFPLLSLFFLINRTSTCTYFQQDRPDTALIRPCAHYPLHFVVFSLLVSILPHPSYHVRFTLIHTVLTYLPRPSDLFLIAYYAD